MQRHDSPSGLRGNRVVIATRDAGIVGYLAGMSERDGWKLHKLWHLDEVLRDNDLEGQAVILDTREASLCALAAMRRIVWEGAACIVLTWLGSGIVASHGGSIIRFFFQGFTHDGFYEQLLGCMHEAGIEAARRSGEHGPGEAVQARSALADIVDRIAGDCAALAGIELLANEWTLPPERRTALRLVAIDELSPKEMPEHLARPRTLQRWISEISIELGVRGHAELATSMRTIGRTGVVPARLRRSEDWLSCQDL